jgi:integrase
MRRQDAQSPAKEIGQSLKYNQVLNRKNQRVRGLWERNGVYYAQVNVRGWIGRVPLHDAATVADAQIARQVLKVEIKAGTWKTPPERELEIQKNVGTEVGTGGAGTPEKRVLKTAIKGYQASRDLLGKKDPKTRKREDSGLKLWSAYKPDLPVAPESFDQKLLLAFAEGRKLKAKEKGRPIKGRSIDVNITALANVIRWCVINGWLSEFPPSWHWDALGESPEECELLTEAQVEALCAAAKSVQDMGLLDPKRPRPSLEEYLDRLRVARQRFADYLHLLSISGARETETLKQRWANVRWGQRKFHFSGGRKGGTKRGGGSRQAAKPRDIDFFDKLEAHLKEMYERRDPKSDWMFPNEDGSCHVKSYRKQLERVREACELPFVGFHHFRHYFISWCIMKGVDVKTVARWVGHLDEGLLILQKYGHLAPGHGQEAAKKLDGPWH